MLSLEIKYDKDEERDALNLEHLCHSLEKYKGRYLKFGNVGLDKKDNIYIYLVDVFLAIENIVGMQIKEKDIEYYHKNMFIIHKIMLMEKGIIKFSPTIISSFQESNKFNKNFRIFPNEESFKHDFIRNKIVNGLDCEK